MKRQLKGQPTGGQFAPDTSGKTPPPTQGTSAVLPLENPVNAPGVTDLYEQYRSTLPPIPPFPSPEDPTHIIVLRGLPASGKSTWSKEVVEAYPPGSVVRINNDDLCTMLYGKTRGGGERAADFLASARERLLDAALSNPDVRLVLIDNTNLAPRNLTATFRTAVRMGATMEVNDFFLNITEEECQRRNAGRVQPVPPEVISRMARQARKLKPWTPPARLPQVEPYHNDPSLPPVTIVDVDGTLAHMSPERGPFDWGKVGLDTPNTAVVAVVQGMLATGRHVKVFSGRSDACRAETQRWLDEHVAPGLELHMRAASDSRPDHLVKLDLFNDVVRDKHHVQCVIDDRDQVVDLWRRKLQVPTFQVADGNF